jgi:hypothetical protein
LKKKKEKKACCSIMLLTFYEAQAHFVSFHFAKGHFGMTLTDAYGFINNI